MIRVVIPVPLRELAGTGAELALEIDGPVTQRTILDQIETLHPALKGTIRDHATAERRAFLRFFACGRDLSHQAPDDPVPDEVATGEEPYLIIGAVAGG